ncbi:hypothetical protein DS884_03765, partial [Tenacibaculum sp. E3R01]|uniref:non-ribosomal peptide synthetase n=1 Tax=Tenacibaculum sp. E3R01 TaxID=2267227 RepID=UPI000DEAC8FE
MKIDEYISDLRKKNIIISVKEGKISLKGSKEKITPEVIKELTAKKQDILTFFKSIKKVKEFESIKPAPKQNYYPLSSSQLRMYFLYNFDKESTSYNVPGFYRVSRNLDVLKLEQVFQKLSNRHHSLRTVFEIVDGNPVQRVLDSNSLKVTRHQGTASEINRYMDSFVRPFDLSKELPIRISLMEVLEEDYLLMIDMHHIINDGVSSEVLMHDFWSLYQGNVLPDLPIQYIDYAVWQQSDVYKDLISSHKEYWLDRYSDEFTVLEIPTDYTRPIQLGNEGSAYTLSLSKKQSDKLRDFASSHGATMYMLFLAIYNVLLNKLSNQDDIIIGTPTVGRRHSDLEGIVGLFVNTLALRNQITSDVSFSDLLAKIQEDTLKAFDHQLYPYEELIDALDVSRNVGRNPLFNVFFSYNQQEGSTSSSNDSDLKIVNHEVLYNIAKFDLELDVINQGDYYDMLFSYNLSLFDEKTIKRFSTYLEAIIEQIVTEGNIKISEIDILSKEEKSQIIHEFNAPETNYNIKGTVVDLIEEQVFFNPKAKALYFKNHTIDYGELNSKVNKLAHYLINVMGVQKGDQVGVHFGRSPEMIIGFLAVLKSGAAYVSLDPDNPSSRINLLIENSNLKFILTNSYEKLLAINTSVEVIDLIREGLNIGEMPSNNPLVKIKESDPAYIIYTSGSTGKPKGIVIEHSSLVDYSITFKEYFSLTTSDKVVQQASPAFDTVVEEVFPALLTGASIVIMPDGGKNIESLLKEIKETKATILSTVPVVVDALNNYSDALESLRLIVSGGDVLLPRHISNLIEKYPIYNTYGPSESTVCITYHKVSSLDNTSCIGKPIPNRQVYILNKDKQLCPVGVTGELCVSGKGLAKEYLNDKKLTEDKFIKNPIIPTSRIYRTGDTAKWNSDGTIEFLGRVDNQVKIRGVRIELGEI